MIHNQGETMNDYTKRPMDEVPTPQLVEELITRIESTIGLDFVSDYKVMRLADRPYPE
jgi:hypothetical protein